MKYETFDWYEDDPRFYDMVFDTDTEIEADFLVAAHEAYGRSDGRRVLEPACGTGRLVAALGRRGYEVEGFDISPASLRYARERLERQGVEGCVREARMESFTCRRKFDLAHCLVSTFRYLLDEASARSHLESVARALRRGGIYVLGLHVCDYAETKCSRERWTAAAEGVEVVCNIQGWPADRRRRQERVRSRLIVRETGTERRLESEWAFRTYDVPQLNRLLAQVPQLEHVATHDFRLEMDCTVPFDGEVLDNVLILRKR